MCKFVKASDLVAYHRSRFFYAADDGSYDDVFNNKSLVEGGFLRRPEEDYGHCFSYIPTKWQREHQGVYYYRTEL